MARTVRKAYMAQGKGIEVIDDRVKRGLFYVYRYDLDREADRQRRQDAAWSLHHWFEAMD
jgi:hypothetical protein